MLKLKQIKKNYLSGENTVNALKDINVQFRENEFVSILGPSGCGKTTLLNIIGGLDRYTSGDLIINGKTTKEFKDSDWDTYRNHSIGFVFQSYNLIPHQTVLSNVELALTLSGVSKKERRKRAIQMLEKVGLGDQINKKPNQMSGGQMQRVAIARALINNPDILLADEPTGALDSTTSVQIMELLKEIAKDKLVIMVTHNPELAEKYSSRIIKLLDGEIIEDTNPYEGKQEENKNIKQNNKTKMNAITAFNLSLNNLMTKKGRTILTAFAGSIGIIGIALILSLSNGVQNYINRVQEDALSSYPIQIQESTVDMGSMLATLMEEAENTNKDEKENDKIFSKSIITDMLSTFSNQIEKNNLKEFRTFLESGKTNIKDYTTAIKYGYNLDLNLYKEKDDGSYVQVNPSKLMDAFGMGTMVEEQSAYSISASYTSQYNVWTELLDNEKLLKSQYDVIAGKWPTAYNEVVLIVGENNEISDYTLYSLGLKDQEELTQIIEKIKNGEKVEKLEAQSFTYDELLDISFKLLLNSDYFEKSNDIWIDKTTDEEYIKNKLNEAIDINIVGIIRPNEESVINSQPGLIGYTKELQEYVIQKVNEAEISKEQKENETKNIFTGREFSQETSTNFNYNNLSNEEKAYMQSLTEEERMALITAYSQNTNTSYEGNLKRIGVVDINVPSTVEIYPKNFEAKEEIERIIQEYNDEKKDKNLEEDVINYTDVVGILMSSITTIIDVISYVLIAFVSISLIVSSIMIGIITYISVLERTKEIGILRSIGASKKDISRVFNAETFIIGITAGAIGIGVTLLLNIPINIIIKSLSGISATASLPFGGAIILIAISTILTMIAGLIPAKIAAKKDPVEALRTE